MGDSFQTGALQRLEDCVRAYALHLKGTSVHEIGRQFGAKAPSARLMIERGALLEGRVVADFSDRTRVCHLPLPVRVARALAQLDIQTVGQARTTPDDKFLRHPGFGPKALRTLRTVLASRA